MTLYLQLIIKNIFNYVVLILKLTVDIKNTLFYNAIVKNY